MSHCCAQRRHKGCTSAAELALGHSGGPQRSLQTKPSEESLQSAATCSKPPLQAHIYAWVSCLPYDFNVRLRIGACVAIFFLQVAQQLERQLTTLYRMTDSADAGAVYNELRRKIQLSLARAPAP